MTHLAPLQQPERRFDILKVWNTLSTLLSEAGGICVPAKLKFASYLNQFEQIN
jgi:hypothetical protein